MVLDVVDSSAATIVITFPLFICVDLHQLTLRWACNHKKGKNLYTTDLLKLEPCSLDIASNPVSVPTTLPVDQREPFLHTHPDHKSAATDHKSEGLVSGRSSVELQGKTEACFP